MSEIGSGSGSSYPGTLDTNATIEVDAPNAGKTKAKAAIVNDLAACILSIETELGVDPAGSKATVVARLDQEHNADGSHKDSYVVTVSGSPQTVTGHKVFASGIDVGIWGIIGSDTNHRAGRTAVGTSGAMWFQDDVRTSGSIHIARNPVLDLEVAPKQYVDTKLSRNSRFSVTSGAVTLTTSNTPIVSVSLIPLIVNDILLISINLTVLKGATAGRILMDIVPTGGSATIIFSGGNTVVQHNFYQEAGISYIQQLTAMAIVTVAGTAPTIEFNGRSYGSNATIGVGEGDMDVTILRT